MTYYAQIKQIVMEITETGQYNVEAGVKGWGWGGNFECVQTEKQKKLERDKLNKSGDNSRDSCMGHSSEQV